MRQRKGMNDAERLGVLLSKTVSVGDCKVWTGCANTDGYPRVCWKGNANGKGHRIVFSLSNPEVNLEGRVVRHTCDNPMCINPEHLLSGTIADNVQDRDSRFRHGASKLTPEQVVEIFNLTNQTEKPLKEIAEKYGVDQRTVSSIKLKKHWKHLLL